MGTGTGTLLGSWASLAPSWDVKEEKGLPATWGLCCPLVPLSLLERVQESRLVTSLFKLKMLLVFACACCSAALPPLPKPCMEVCWETCAESVLKMVWMTSFAASRTDSAGLLPFMGSAGQLKFTHSRREEECCCTALRKERHSGLLAMYLMAFSVLRFTITDLFDSLLEHMYEAICATVFSSAFFTRSANSWRAYIADASSLFDVRESIWDFLPMDPKKPAMTLTTEAEAAAPFLFSAPLKEWISKARKCVHATLCHKRKTIRRERIVMSQDLATWQPLDVVELEALLFSCTQPTDFNQATFFPRKKQHLSQL
jgi:hypothetical protein